MGNLVWTAITYAATIGIVLIIFRMVVKDRIADNLRATRLMAQLTGQPLSPESLSEELSAQTKAPPTHPRRRGLTADPGRRQQRAR